LNDAGNVQVVGLPCNQFGGQEPHSNEELLGKLKERGYVPNFPLLMKAEMNGKNAHKFVKWTKMVCFGEHKETSWNFEKFLFSKDGIPLAHFDRSTRPGEIGKLAAQGLAQEL
jgi:glutathione peroxidase